MSMRRYGKTTPRSVRVPNIILKEVRELSKITHHNINESFFLITGYEQWISDPSNLEKLPTHHIERLIQDKRQEMADLEETISKLEQIILSKKSQQTQPQAPSSTPRPRNGNGTGRIRVRDIETLEILEIQEDAFDSAYYEIVEASA